MNIPHPTRKNEWLDGSRSEEHELIFYTTKTTIYVAHFDGDQFVKWHKIAKQLVMSLGLATVGEVADLFFPREAE